MILFFDDEPVRMEPWREALEKAFGPVHPISKAADLVAFLEQEPRPPVELFVFDSMAPTPTGLTDEDTDYGTRTGIALFDRFHARYPDVPAILLTNVRDDPLLKRFDAPEKKLRSGRKGLVGPKALVRLALDLGLKPLA